MISMPANLLVEMDGVVAQLRGNRSELIREAVRLYLGEQRKKDLREKLKQGYLQMAETNLAMAKAALPVENEADFATFGTRAVGVR
jgi:CopG family transcriptional regulator/antitoxin EndoAI